MQPLHSLILTVCTTFVLSIAPNIYADNSPCGSAKMPCWSSDGDASKSSASEKQAFYEELLEPMVEEYIASDSKNPIDEKLTKEDARTQVEYDLQAILNSKVSIALIEYGLEKYTPNTLNKIVNGARYNKSPVFGQFMSVVRLIQATAELEKSKAELEKAKAKLEKVKEINKLLDESLKKLSGGATP